MNKLKDWYFRDEWIDNSHRTGAVVYMVKSDGQVTWEEIVSFIGIIKD